MDEYLHADAVENGDIIKITGKARYVSAEEATFGRSYLEIAVKLPNGKTKIWTPNKTTLKKLAKIFGDDSDTWIGKRVKLSVAKQNVHGEMRDVLYGEAVEQVTPTQEKTLFQ